MIKTLNRRQHKLSDPAFQVSVLSDPQSTGVVEFNEKLAGKGLLPLKAYLPEILQINLGKMCNQTCRHCHVDAGPDRTEIMTRQTMQEILAKIPGSPISTLDLTGGAPELNPEFRWFVDELMKFKKHLMVRSNLTIIVSNKKYHDLPEFFRHHDIEIIASLPYFSANRTNAQRGEGVFEKSVQALKMLNKAGYGSENSNLKLNLVYNPTGAFLPGNQQGLEREFKNRLQAEHGIVFNNLFTITNLPISRFLDYLISTGNLESYMHKLVNAFNPAASEKLMCRNTLSIGWDGSLFDCDFNQMLDLSLNHGMNHIKDLNWRSLEGREIITNRHCFGCTAGAGSSCGGALT